MRIYPKGVKESLYNTCADRIIEKEIDSTLAYSGVRK
jgi:hypothetical protein